jgi:hypothetical protein
MAEHYLTTDVAPFSVEDNAGHELFVLAAVFDLKAVSAKHRNLDAMRFPTYRQAKSMQLRWSDAGVDAHIHCHVLDAIDLTAAIETDFGESLDPARRAAYKASWCGRRDRTVIEGATS